MSIAYNTCVGIDCKNEWVLVIGELLWIWIGGHLLGCGEGGGLYELFKKRHLMLRSIQSS